MTIDNDPHVSPSRFPRRPATLVDHAISRAKFLPESISILISRPGGTPTPSGTSCHSFVGVNFPSVAGWGFGDARPPPATTGCAGNGSPLTVPAQPVGVGPGTPSALGRSGIAIKAPALWFGIAIKAPALLFGVVINGPAPPHPSPARGERDRAEYASELLGAHPSSSPPWLTSS